MVKIAVDKSLGTVILLMGKIFVCTYTHGDSDKGTYMGV